MRCAPSHSPCLAAYAQVAALYQVKADLNAAQGQSTDLLAKPHQPLPEFVPDQFIVLRVRTRTDAVYTSPAVLPSPSHL